MSEETPSDLGGPSPIHRNCKGIMHGTRNQRLCTEALQQQQSHEIHLDIHNDLDETKLDPMQEARRIDTHKLIICSNTSDEARYCLVE